MAEPLEIHKELHLLGNGKEIAFDVVHRPYFVIAIPRHSDHQRLLLIRQYRPSWRTFSVEFPAGVSDSTDTNYEHTCRRELEEEAGFMARKLTRLGVFKHSSRTTQECVVFLAEDLQETATNFDEGEFIEEAMWMTPDEIERSISSGVIMDVSHIAAWSRYRAHANL